MTGRIYFAFITTFLMGMFAGAYFYVTIYAPAYESGTNGDTQVRRDSFVIDAQMYGGCAESGACASFRLVDGRSYSFAESQGAEVVEGKLPRTTADRLEIIFTEEVLQEHAEPFAQRDCDAYVDGIDYTYTIARDGVTYQLDTCTTKLSLNSALQDELLDVWYLIENPELVPEEKVEFDISNLFKERFQNAN